MADNEKPTTVTQTPDKPTVIKSTEAKANTKASSSLEDNDDEDDEPTTEELEQSVIQAEIEAGKAVLNANNRLQKARDKLAASLNPVNKDSDSGYGVKIWAGAKILQCYYCPLDVPADEEDRMIAHIDASHPNHANEPHLYDNLGNALV